MLPEIAMLLLSLGCAPAQFTGPAGAFNIWVCPPVAEESAPEPHPAQPEAPKAEERAL